MEISGIYNTAKIYTDTVDDASLAQVKMLCDQAFTAQSRIRMMPDIHAGAGCTIGTTMTIRDCVSPNLVGVDIGCGMETVQIRETRLELQKLDKLIYEKIPAGFSIRTKTHRYFEQAGLDRLLCKKAVKIQRAEKSLGTLGGGNHFIEVDKDQHGKLYLVVHSGSRHLGVEVAGYYQKMGYAQLGGKQRAGVPYELAYVSGALFQEYLQDMKVVQAYARLNRQAIIEEILKGMKLHTEEQFTTVHNYIDTEQMILRKGAVSAEKGEKLLIPLNMRDGSLICTGKGNEEWNFSAPHGAGRLMSRSEAKQNFTVSDFKRQMQEVYSTSVGKNTLDECPMAYKDKNELIKNIGDTAEIMKIIQPVYNFKAGGEM